MAIKDYSQTPASNTLNPEGMAAAAVNNNMRQMQADIRVDYDDPEYRDRGHTPVFVSWTAGTKTLVMKIEGVDVTSYYLKNMLFSIDWNSTTYYGYISTNATFSTDTTVTGIINTTDTLANPVSNLKTYFVDPNKACPFPTYHLLAGETGVTNLEYNYYDIRRFGWVGDNVADDTSAWNNALLSIVKSGTRSGKIFIPYTSSGSKLTSTINISGHDGLLIEFEEPPAYSRTADVAAYQAIKWHGSAGTPVFVIKGICSFIEIKNMSIDAMAGGNRAIAGIEVGEASGSHQMRNLTIDGYSCFDARLGLHVGMNNGNVDGANIRIKGSVFITGCVDAGIAVTGGNCVVTIDGPFLSGNGTSPTTDADNPNGLGANMFQTTGSIFLKNYTGNGKSANKPTNADVYQHNGYFQCDQAWSDAHGYFFYQVNSDGPVKLSGVRHFEGSMDGTNTPTSVRLRRQGSILESCRFYNDVQIDTGVSGNVVANGVEFIAAGAGFTGSSITSQHALMQFGGDGNQASIKAGGYGSNGAVTDFNSLNYNPALLQVVDMVLAEVRNPKNGSSLRSGYVITEPDSDGQFFVLVNCYESSSGNYKAFDTGRGLRVHFTNVGINVSGYNFPDTTSAVAAASFSQIFSITENTISTANVSNPPTDAELDAALGTPGGRGKGFYSLVDDAGGDANVYLVYSNGTSWWYSTLTKAV